MSADPKDQNLVDAARNGDDEAFAELVSRYEKKVLGLCFRHLRQYEEACDLAQEIFLQVYHHLKDFRGQASFSTWVYRISLNACYNRLRWMKAKGRNRVDSLDGLLEMREGGPDSSRLMASRGKDPLGALETQELKDRVWRGLRKLNEDFQKVIELVDLEGMAYEEAAGVLEIPVNTVRSRLSRARQGLKKALEKEQREKDRKE